MPGLDNLGKKKKVQYTPPETKTVIKVKNPFDRQDLTDIEDLIANKISNYKINITNYMKRNGIINENDPKLILTANYRQKVRYLGLLEKIQKLKEEL